jgi:hypothetical protein
LWRNNNWCDAGRESSKNLIPNFNHIVVAIEESNKLATCVT